MAIHQEQFRVSIDAFDGPLDLLLYLVRRAEVDIYDIPIAQISDEYLEVLRQSPSVDVEMAGEFLVMAATLIELKSRALVPDDQIAELENEISEESSIDDPKGDLIRQLLAFQRIRTASELLESRRLVFMNRFEVHSAMPALQQEEPEHALELDDIHILDLADAYEHIASSIDFNRIGEHHVAFEDIPIELCQDDLLDRLLRAEKHSVTLQETFKGLSLPERIGMFLATLELVRSRRITVIQESTWGDIILEMIEDPTTEISQTSLES